MSLKTKMGGLAEAVSSRSRLLREPPNGYVRAAVLVPVLVRGEDLFLLFMRRTDVGGPHSGQISFPGGRLEPGDRNLTEAALRETHEEFGIPPEHVKVMGLLDDEITVSGYVVTPVLGTLEPFDFRPDPAEVEEIFDVPLSFFLDPRNENESPPVSLNDEWFTLFQYEYEGKIIWGLTARIIHGLKSLVLSSVREEAETER